MEFYIKQLTATGPTREASSIIFKPGLNIICGASDTGKTAVLKSIKFMFGGSKPFDKKKKGFDCITMKVQTLSGEIQLSRKIGKNTIDVVSEVDIIKSGTYDASYNDKDGNKNPVIHKLWLKLMGSDNEPRIIKNQLKERKHFTMPTILQSFYLNEDDINENGSVILPARKSESKTLTLSAILYMITGNDFASLESEESDVVTNAKKTGMEMYAHARIQELTERIDQIRSEMEAFKGIDVSAELENDINLLSNLDEQINKHREQLVSIIHQTNELDNQSAELELVLSKHNSLQSQYSADIQRLAFIAEGEKITHNHPQSIKCPFCDGTINPSKKNTYIEAAKNELARIMTQAKGLSENTEEINSQLKSIKDQLAELNNTRKNIERMIDNALAPQAERLKDDIVAYRHYLQLQQEYEVLDEVCSSLNLKLMEQTNQVSEKETDNSFKPTKHFPQNFSITMSEYAKTILEACNYPGLSTVEFNLSKFDLLINGDLKSESHGKGYRAFINTALGLAMRQYYHENAKYNPGLFIVDTPQHGLNQGSDDSPKSMKYGLFSYLIEQKNVGQTIIVENIDHLPDIDFEALGINIMDFTHDNYESKFSDNRYGFLIGVTS